MLVSRNIPKAIGGEDPAMRCEVLLREAPLLSSYDSVQLF